MGIEKARAQLGPLANRAEIGGEITYLTRNGRRIAAIVPLDRIKETTMDTTTYTAAIGLVSSVVAGDHCDLTVAENGIVGYRDDEDGTEVPQYAMSSNIVLGPVETAVRTDGDVAAEVYDAADEALSERGWRRVGAWDDTAGDVAYATVERA